MSAKHPYWPRPKSPRARDPALPAFSSGLSPGFRAVGQADPGGRQREGAPCRPSAETTRATRRAGRRPGEGVCRSPPAWAPDASTPKTARRAATDRQRWVCVVTRSAPGPRPPARGAACGAGEGWPERWVRHARHLRSPHGAHTATPKTSAPPRHPALPHIHSHSPSTASSATLAGTPCYRAVCIPLSTAPRSPRDSAAPPTPAPGSTAHTPHSHRPDQPPHLHTHSGPPAGPPRASDRVARALPGVHVCPGAGTGTGTAAGGAPLPSRPARSPGPSPRPAPRGGAERDGRREGGRWRSGGGGGQEAEAERAGRGPRGPVRHSGESAAAGAGRPRAKGAAAGPGAGRGGQRPPGAALALCSRAGSREGGASGRSRARAWPRRPPRAPRPRRAPESDAAGEDGARIAPQVTEAGTEFEGKATSGARSRECDRLRLPDLRTVSAPSVPCAAAAVTPTSPAAAVQGSSCSRAECTGAPGTLFPLCKVGAHGRVGPAHSAPTHLD